MTYIVNRVPVQLPAKSVDIKLENCACFTYDVIDRIFRLGSAEGAYEGQVSFFMNANSFRELADCLYRLAADIDNGFTEER